MVATGANGASAANLAVTWASSGATLPAANMVPKLLGSGRPAWQWGRLAAGGL